MYTVLLCSIKIKMNTVLPKIQHEEAFFSGSNKNSSILSVIEKNYILAEKVDILQQTEDLNDLTRQILPLGMAFFSVE